MPTTKTQQQSARAVVVDDLGRVLLLRRVEGEKIYPGYWNLPGGKVNADETIREASDRELIEETGLQARNTGKTFQYQFPGGVATAFLYRDAGGHMQIEAEESSQAAWFNPWELPEPLMPGTAESIYALAGQQRVVMGELMVTPQRLRLEAWAGRQIAPWLKAHVLELAEARGTLKKSVGDDAAGEEAMYRVLVRAMKLGRAEAASALLGDLRTGRREGVRDLTPKERDMLRTIARRNVRLVKATTEAALVPIAQRDQAATVQTLLEKLYDMKRANLIGADMVSKGYANGVIDVLKANGYRYVYWRTMEDERVCRNCGPMNNARMTMRQFLKRAPIHPRCRCWPATQPEIARQDPEWRDSKPEIQYGERPRRQRPPREQTRVFAQDSSGQLLLPWRSPSEPPARVRKRRMRKSMTTEQKGVITMDTLVMALRALSEGAPLTDGMRKAVDPETLARVASENAKKRNRGPGGKFAAGKITAEEAAKTKTKKAADDGAGTLTEKNEPSPLAHLPRDTKAPHALMESGQRLLAHLRTLKPGTAEHKHNLAQYNAVRDAIAAHNEKSSSTNQVERGANVKMPAVPTFVQGGADALKTPKQFTLALQAASTRGEALALGSYLEHMERRDGLRGKDWDAAWDGIMARANKLPEAATGNEAPQESKAPVKAPEQPKQEQPKPEKQQETPKPQKDAKPKQPKQPKPKAQDQAKKEPAKPEREKVGQGMTGDAERVGDEVEKNARHGGTGDDTGEGDVYKALEGVPGIAPGKRRGDKIVTPYYPTVLSVDATSEKDREQHADAIRDNLARVAAALGALSDKGYDYADPLQFGVDADGQMHLLDFSNATKRTERNDDPHGDNSNHLALFLEQFGASKEADNVTNARVALKELRGMLLMARTFGKPMGIKIGGRDYPDATEKWHERTGDAMFKIMPDNAYFSDKPMDVDGAVTFPTDNGYVILSANPLTAEQIAGSDLLPVIHRGDNKELAQALEAKRKQKADKAAQEQQDIKDWADAHVSAGEAQAEAAADKGSDAGQPDATEPEAGDESAQDSAEPDAEQASAGDATAQEAQPDAGATDAKPERKPSAQKRAKKELTEQEKAAIERNKRTRARTAKILDALKQVQAEHTTERLDKSITMGDEADALDELLKALIWIKEHQRQDGTRVKAHQRNVQTKGERDDLIAAIAKRMSDGEHVQHANGTSAIVSARAISKQTGKTTHAYRHEDGSWRTSHELPDEHVNQKGRVIAERGKTRHLVDGKETGFTGVRGAVALHDPTKVKPKKEQKKKDKQKLPASQKAQIDEYLKFASIHYDLAWGQSQSALAKKNDSGYEGHEKFVSLGNEDTGQFAAIPREYMDDHAVTYLASHGFKPMANHQDSNFGMRVTNKSKFEIQKDWKPSDKKQIAAGKAGTYNFYAENVDNNQRELANNSDKKNIIHTELDEERDASYRLISLQVDNPLRTWDPEQREEFVAVLEDLYQRNREAGELVKTADGKKANQNSYSFHEHASNFAKKRADDIAAGKSPNPFERDVLTRKYDAIFQKKGKNAWLFYDKHEAPAQYPVERYKAREFGHVMSPKYIKEVVDIGIAVPAHTLRHYPMLERQHKIESEIKENGHTYTIDDIVAKLGSSVPLEKLGAILAEHKRAVFKAVADGKDVRPDVKNIYFELADGPKLPKGPSADSVIKSLASVADEIKGYQDERDKYENEAESIKKALAAQRSEWWKEDPDKRGQMPEFTTEQKEKVDELYEKVDEIYRSIQLLKRQQMKIVADLKGAGAAKYTAHIDPKIAPAHRADIEKGLQSYAAWAGERAGHRHVVVQYIENQGSDGLHERAYFDQKREKIGMGEGLMKNQGWRSVAAVVHEMAHGLEYEHTQNAKISAQFVFDHTEHEYKPLNEMRRMRNGDPEGAVYGFRDNEKGRVIKQGDDAIWDDYLTKLYGRSGQDVTSLDEVDATEVISMGMEQLHIDPVGFITRCPEHFRVVWSMLRDTGE